jgi:hypothetical protein
MAATGKFEEAPEFAEKRLEILANIFRAFKEHGIDVLSVHVGADSFGKFQRLFVYSGVRFYGTNSINAGLVEIHDKRGVIGILRKTSDGFAPYSSGHSIPKELQERFF